jgi:hypothetical protein
MAGINVSRGELLAEAPETTLAVRHLLDVVDGGDGVLSVDQRRALRRVAGSWIAASTRTWREELRFPDDTR